MTNDSGEKCILKFQSPKDLLSAVLAAEKLGIPVEKNGGEKDFSISIPIDRVSTFQSLGSINFGIKVRA